MAKISLNEFVKREKRVGVGFIFDEYYHAKKSSKITGKIPLKSGGELPTPNEVIRKLAASCKGDYHLKSEGAIQTLMLTDEEDVKAFIKAGPPLTRSDGRPLNAIAAIHVSMERHQELAKTLGLI